MRLVQGFAVRGSSGINKIWACQGDHRGALQGIQLTDVFPVAVRRTEIVAKDPYTAGPLKKTL